MCFITPRFFILASFTETFFILLSFMSSAHSIELSWDIIVHSCLIWFGRLNLNTRTVMFFFYFKEYKKTGIDCSSIPESLEPYL